MSKNMMTNVNLHKLDGTIQKAKIHYDIICNLQHIKVGQDVYVYKPDHNWSILTVHFQQIKPVVDVSNDIEFYE